jgi:hypothetical protein
MFTEAIDFRVGSSWNYLTKRQVRSGGAILLSLLCWTARAGTVADPFSGGGAWLPYTNNPILTPGPPGSWDAGAIETMTVVNVAATYHLYYEGWARRADGTLGVIQIGHATSNDGLHWTKDPLNPVLPKGKGNEWDRSGTWDPSILYEDGIFKLWYGGSKGQDCEWGYAASIDGARFEKHGQLSQLGQVEDDHVVHDRATGRYFMYYWNRQYEPEGLYCAQSPNETNFDFASAQPIHIAGLPYSTMMYKFPNVFQDGGQWFMFFGQFVRPGCADCWTGYATSKDGLRWQLQNPQVIKAHDAFIVRAANNLYYMYYGPDGLFDQPDDDIRLAVYDVKQPPVITTEPHKSN